MAALNVHIRDVRSTLIDCLALSNVMPGFSLILWRQYVTLLRQRCLKLILQYPLYAASALAANSFLRSVFAAAFPLFGNQMFTSE